MDDRGGDPQALGEGVAQRVAGERIAGRGGDDPFEERLVACGHVEVADGLDEKAQVLLEAARVGDRDGPRARLDQGVAHDALDGAPAPPDRRRVDAGALGDALHGERGVAAVRELVQGGAQHGLARTGRAPAGADRTWGV